MSESKRIVLILGNGFDLDLGLKTSYKDFWESDNCPKDYPAPLVNHLNQCFSDDLEKVKWYDLENEIYYYAKKIVSIEARRDIITKEERSFIEAFNTLQMSYGVIDQNNSLLLKGLIKDNGYSIPRFTIPYREDLLKTPVERDRIALERIKSGLCLFVNEKSLSKKSESTVAFRVLLSLLKADREDQIVEIYTFNYTPAWKYGHRLDGIDIQYVHGCCDKGSIIVGTRDDLSLENDYVFIQKSFDPTFYPPHIVDSLHAADEVIIFGHSIGENDRQYFKAFFKEQSNYSHIVSKKITIFTKDHLSEIQVKLALQNMTDGNLSTLFGQNTMRIIKTNELREDLENRKRFKEFLLNHNTEERSAEEIIGDLLSRV